MTELPFKKIWLIAIAFFLAGSAICRAEYDYINISNPFLRKIPLAVPLFKAMSGTPAEMEVSEKASGLLSQTLDYTRYFEILNLDANIEQQNKSDIIAPNINFQNWTSMGAELLVTGGVLVKDDLLKMELRLYDTFKGQLIIGKKYTAGISDQRKIILSFCREVIYRLTGNRGFFNSKIAFVSTSSGNKEIYICEFDGYNPVQFTHNKSITLFPAWSSDAEWLAYTSYVQGKPDLYIRHIKEKQGAIVSKMGINTTPAWVPGRFELAATLSFSGDPEIYLLTGRGKVIKRLTNEKGIGSSPTWSPDGKKMAFVSRRSGTPQIYIEDLDSGQVDRLTFQGKYNTQPSWSPKGDRIAYSAMEKGETNIKVIGFDGQGAVQLTHADGDNESPTWSPEGSLIAFSSNREGPSRIYVMTAYGTDQKRLLVLPGEQTNPNWSPEVSDN